MRVFINSEERKLLLLSLFVFIIAVPVVLNYLLPIQTGLTILGQPIEWLSFWASYLAAVGSFTLAMVSLWMNKRLHLQNDKTINYVRWDKMVDRYNRIERFVIEEEQLHSEWSLRYMLSYIETHDDKNVQLFCCNKEILLLSCSLKIARFVEREKAWDYKTETGKILYEYGCIVSKVNTDLCELFKRELKNHHSKKEWKELINQLIEKEQSLFAELESKRMAYLLVEKKRIAQFAEENNLEVYM